MSILDRIRRVDFPRAQYAQVAHPKRQIVLHHTVSGVGIDGDIATWLGNSARIATCLIIHHDGTPWQCFSSRYWAHHLGCKRALFRAQGFDAVESRNLRLNQQSIAIEIDSAGGLTQRDGAWYSSFGRRIPTDRVQVYADGYRGFHGFEKYTEEQLRSVEELLRWWQAERYPDIPLAYRPTMWDVEHDALAGEPGVYSHTSFRPDKSDCHPQPELIEMLRGLEGDPMNDDTRPTTTKDLRFSDVPHGAKARFSRGRGPSDVFYSVIARQPDGQDVALNAIFESDDAHVDVGLEGGHQRKITVNVSVSSGSGGACLVSYAVRIVPPSADTYPLGDTFGAVEVAADLDTDYATVDAL